MSKKQSIRTALFFIAPIVLIYAWIVVLFQAPQMISSSENSHLMRDIFKKDLAPAAIWVRGFATSNGRLPTDPELADYSTAHTGRRIWIYRERPAQWKDSWLDSWPAMGHEFLLCAFIPEWNLYLCSWNNKEVRAWTD